MKDLKDTCSVALAQLEPVLFNKAESLEKVLGYIEWAARMNVDLIVFPEMAIPGYPYGLTFGFRVGSRDEDGRVDWKRYYDSSVVVPGPETEAIGEAAKEAHAYVSIGVSERDAVSGTLYNTNLIFGPEGDLLSVHRKIKPTGAERMVWGDADRGYFPVVDTPWGPMGSLICWESYMPLARVALYEKGVTIYIAPNTNDNIEWQSTIRHIAIEGKCFVLNSDLIFHRRSYPKDLLAQDEVRDLNGIVCRGGSCIIDPYGHYVVKPVWNKEGILYGELNMQDAAASRMEFDACGHYSRPDIFHFSVEDK